MDAQDGLTVDEILDLFRNYSGVYEKEAVAVAVDHRTEIVPRLIEILRMVSDDPTPYLEDEDLFDHIYAVMLLGHFKATEAHQTIIDVFSLPDDMTYQIFGDTGTSDLPMILLRTCGGSLEAIKAMALNREIGEYNRNSALQAMSYAVVAGVADRDETLAFFRTLFTGEETDADSDFWGLLACNILELYPEESMDTIKQGYEDGLIASGMVGYGDFEKTLKEGKEKTFERLKANYDRNSLDDIHGSMSWWACFKKEDRPRREPDLSHPFFDTPNRISTKVQKKKNTTAKKKKRKQAKKSKRKNRR
jgi:hypothetical protein